MTPFKDASTVFSIVPFFIHEFKPGIYPGDFKIAPCMDDRSPERLVVSESQHLMTIGGRREPIRIMQASHQIARSIVEDFLNAQLWAIPGCCPGICWVNGDISVNDFTVKNKDIYDRIKADQKNWFIRLIKETDNDWTKYRNHRVISEHAKFGARALGLKPEWMQSEEIALNFNNCPACNVMNDPKNAICSNCKCVLNESKYKTLAFAK